MEGFSQRIFQLKITNHKQNGDNFMPFLPKPTVIYLLNYNSNCIFNVDCKNRQTTTFFAKFYENTEQNSTLPHHELRESIDFVGLITSPFMFYTEIIKYILPCYKSCFVLYVHTLVFSYPGDAAF